jgi:hypothetical protein
MEPVEPMDRMEPERAGPFFPSPVAVMRP